MNTTLSGSEILIRSLLFHKVDTIFGYPGSCVMSILDCLYDYKGTLDHILVRHEQGAIYAAQGYAQVLKKTGVAMVTSGPAATNIITGLADAKIDCTPLVIITGQVYSHLLGSDAFQEVDVISIVHSTTKWACQIRSASEIFWAVNHAFYIASSGHPGPVVLDITKDAQIDKAIYSDKKINSIKKYNFDSDMKLPKASETLWSSNQEKNKVDDIIDILQDVEDIVLILDIEHNSASFSIQQQIIKSTNNRTKGLGLPAAIGAKYASPNQTVCLLVGVDEFQTTIQELGVITQTEIEVKIFLVHNSKQTKFEIFPPDFLQIVEAYNIKGRRISGIDSLKDQVLDVIRSEGSYFLEIK